MTNNDTTERRNTPTDIGELLDSDGNPIFTRCRFCGRQVLTFYGWLEKDERSAKGDASLDKYLYRDDCDCPGRTAEREAAYAAEESRAESQSLDSLRKKLKKGNIPDALGDAHLEDWNSDKLGEDAARRIRDAARKYVSQLYYFKNGLTAENPGNMLICGKSGRGKTPLVQLMAVELMRGEGGVNVTYVNYMSLLSELTDVKNYKGKSLQEIVSYYSTRSVLIIDDFGDEEPTTWQVGRIFEILDQRKRKALPTIVTTVYTDSEALTQQLTEKSYGGAQKGSGMAIKLLRRISTSGNLIMLSKS